MASNQALKTVLDAVFSVVYQKKSLSSFCYPNETSAETKSLIFGTIRFYHQLNDIVTKQLKKPFEKSNIDIHCLMLIGAYQLLHSNIATHAAIYETVNVLDSINKSWAKGLVNAVLREIDRQSDSLLNQVHYSHPSWLIKKIKNNYPDHFEQIFTQNNTQAPMSLRLHPSLNISDYQKQLLEIGIHAKTSTVAPQALILDQAVAVNKLPNFDQGACYIQDCSAQLSATVLDPKDGDLILDACAAPGGKTTHLSELAPKSKIIALDSDNSRLQRIHENIERFNIKNINTLQGLAQTQDWWDGQLFDKILLDAPCSATGVIRRHPDIKLLRKPKDVSALVQLQKSILENLWLMLKPGGTLLYATCSILKSENELQINTFLSNHIDAQEIKLDINWGHDAIVGKQQLPEREFDGFYYAKIYKKP